MDTKPNLIIHILSFLAILSSEKYTSLPKLIPKSRKIKNRAFTVESASPTLNACALLGTVHALRTKWRMFWMSKLMSISKMMMTVCN